MEAEFQANKHLYVKSLHMAMRYTATLVIHDEISMEGVSEKAEEILYVAGITATDERIEELVESAIEEMFSFAH